MATVVTGLSPTGDTTSLRAALKDAGFSLDSLTAIGPDDEDDQPDSSLVRPDTRIITSDGGTGVPGLDSGTGRVEVSSGGEALWDRLGDLEIPESELDNYVESVSRGHTVVAYFARPDTVDRVLEVFKGDASLSNVRRF